MDNPERHEAFKLITEHEGFRSKPYYDTVGKLTIGYGRNLMDRGLTREEAVHLLINDIKNCIEELETHLPVFKKLSTTRKAVLIDMVYNIGLPRLLGFKKMLKALEEGNYERAADEMLDSRWAEQVKTRATHLANLMRRG